MSVSVSMPQLGESVTEGTVTRWLKREGDYVHADEPLLEVSTDKVDTEIPSPVSGILRGISVAEDETVAVGAELAVIDEDGAAGGSTGAGLAEPAYAEPAQAEPAPAEATPAESAPAEEPIPAFGAGPGYGQPAYQAYQPPQPVAEPAGDAAYQPPSNGYENPPFAEPAAPPAPAGYQPPGYQPPGYTEPGFQSYQPPAEPAPGYQAPAEPAQGYQAPAEPAQGYQPPQPPAASAAAPPPPPAQTAPAGAGDSPYVTPLVRKLATEHDIDLGSISGTGVGGRIRKQDVLDAARERHGGQAPAAASPAAAQAGPAITGAVTAPPAAGPPAPVAPTAPAASPAPAVAPPVAPAPAVQPAITQPAAAAPAWPSGGAIGRARPPAPPPSSLRGTTERLSRPRQVIAQRMVESLQISAQLTTVVEADVTAIARLRERTKSAFEAREGVRLSFLPFFALATVEALKLHPKLNASIDATAGTVTYHDAEHLGIAVDTERGLMVPVIRNAGDLNIGGLARKIADLAERTRAGQVSPDDLTGGTFTLTNTGSRGALFDTPIINQPQVAILGTGTVSKRAVVLEDPELGEVITVRSVVYLALTYDHRLVDGADAARFLGTIKDRLEEGRFEAELGG